MRFSRNFLHKMWPTQLAILRLIVVRSFNKKVIRSTIKFHGCQNMKGPRSEALQAARLTSLSERQNSCTSIAGQAIIPDVGCVTARTAYALCSAIRKSVISLSCKKSLSQVWFKCNGSTANNHMLHILNNLFYNGCNKARNYEANLRTQGQELIELVTEKPKIGMCWFLSLNQLRGYQNIMKFLKISARKFKNMARLHLTNSLLHTPPPPKKRTKNILPWTNVFIHLKWND